jgi:hypothetical protein
MFTFPRALHLVLFVIDYINNRPSCVPKRAKSHEQGGGGNGSRIRELEMDGDGSRNEEAW